MSTSLQSYPLFKKSAVLKHDELNSILDYINNQLKTTHRCLDGTGIVSGLTIKQTQSPAGLVTLTLEAGFGLTPDGNLVQVESPLTFTHTQAVSTQIGFNGYFLGDVVELSTTGTPLSATETRCIFIGITESENSANGKTQFCFRESDANATKTIELKYYLGTPKTMATEATKPSCFLTPCLPRLLGGNLAKITDEKTLDSTIKALIDKGTESLVSVFSQLVACFPDLFCDQKLDFQKWLTNEKNPQASLYIYDYLKTLIAAYEELANTDYFKNKALALANASPYLLLGNGKNDCTCRQYWQTALPASADFGEAKFYATRLIALTTQTNVSFTNPSIKITVSRSDAAPLSQRAIPFYIKNIDFLHWNYHWSKQNRTGLPVQDCYTEGGTFYRIEGHIGQPLDEVLTKLKDIKQAQNLAFNIVPLNIDTIDWDVNDGTGGKPAEKPSDRGVNVSAIPIDDLEREFQQHKMDALCNLWQFDDPRSEALETLVDFTDTLNFDNFTFKEDILRLKGILEDPKIKEDLTLFAPNFAKLSGRAKFCPFDYLKLIERIYRSRLQLTNFTDFTTCYSGIEPVAGVPRGGTFIVLYKIANTGKEGNKANPIFEQTIIGDLMLPCCDVDVQDVPTAAFSIETIADFKRIDKGQGPDRTRTIQTTGDVTVKVRNLSVNAFNYTWEAKSVPALNIPITKDSYNATMHFSAEELKKVGSITLTLSLTAEKEGKTSVYSETIDIPEKKRNAAIAQPSNPSTPTPVPTPVSTTGGTVKPVTDTTQGEATPLPPFKENIERPRPVSNPQFVVGVEPLKNVATFNQRHESYKKVLIDIEKDPAINDNKAFNLTKVFVFFPKPQAGLTPSFEETTQALFVAINRVKKEEQKRKFISLLTTSTHFYLDKIVASGEQTGITQKALEAVRLSMLKNGINTLEFIVDWKGKAIETMDNKAIITQLMQIFE